MRPYNLPKDISDPPSPPEGFRWSCRGERWESGQVTTYCCFNQISGQWRIYTEKTWGGSVYYLEAVPLRAVPEGVPQPPDGFEYCCDKRIPVPSVKVSSDIASFAVNTDYWDTTSWRGDASNWSYALRIGSEIHHRNFDAEPAPAKDSSEVSETDFVNTTEAETSLPEPKEWDAWESASGNIVQRSDRGPSDQGWRAIRVREIPLPPPPFDWEKLWTQVPAWAIAITMDEDGEWSSSTLSPRQGHSEWVDGGIYNPIPSEFSPPRVNDWKASKRERPSMITPEAEVTP